MRGVACYTKYTNEYIAWFQSETEAFRWLVSIGKVKSTLCSKNMVVSNIGKVSHEVFQSCGGFRWIACKTQPHLIPYRTIPRDALEQCTDLPYKLHDTFNSYIKSFRSIVAAAKFIAAQECIAYTAQIYDSVRISMLKHHSYHDFTLTSIKLRNKAVHTFSENPVMSIPKEAKESKLF